MSCQKKTGHKIDENWISQHLKVRRAGPCADGQGDLVVEHVDEQVEVDGLLPVDVGVADRQLAAVPPEADF